MADKPTLKITLTPEQQEQIKRETGKEITTLKLEALETRLAPGISIN
jgi:hypothetical protein